MATDEEKLVPGGIYQDAHGDVYMRDPCGSNLWLHPGDGRAYADKEVARPLTRYVPAPTANAPAKGKADPYLYRITYSNGKVKHGHRRVLGPVLAAMRHFNYSTPVKIERAAEPAWQDVTSEFLG